LATDGSHGLILTYHAIGRAHGPLAIDPGLFSEHLDCIVEKAPLALTVSELARRATANTLPDGAVAITFDDAFASLVSEAAPMLLERGLTATVFCVAGYLGKSNDWPTQSRKAPRAPLATATALADLAKAGFEIGSHGMEHAPLNGGSASFLERELVESRRLLEDATGAEVRSFAYPYGVLPGAAARCLTEATYESACATMLRRVATGEDRFALPRVDAHYLRRPNVLRLVIRGRLNWYLAARRHAAALRRLVRADYGEAPPSD
jgi:peptidoglycan/xylan/chitin deacetylase (PgdA/CDA1 family)